MTEELKRAKDQVAEWTRSLEDRVEQKTEQLQRAHHRMIKIERMASMGQLAAIVAHEINNPLAGILTYARLLIKRSRTSQWSVNEVTEMREDLELIANEASRCGEIVKGLLQFSRQSKKNYQPNDLNQLIRESLRLIKHKLDLLNIQTSACLESDIPPIVCDAQEIRQALVAIFINACEAVSPNEGIVEAGTRHRMDLGVIEIWVRDNGVGMDEETQKHIFEPFFTTKEHGKGVGLGLAAVIGIVNQHSGEIDVESRPGAGTTFTIRLPLTSEAAASPDAKAVVL
jgi:two-component system NtrC family sensor kinase